MRLTAQLAIRCLITNCCTRWLGNFEGLSADGGAGGFNVDLSNERCRVDVSPTDESPTENSWMLRPLNKTSLGYCVPDRCVPTLDRVEHGTSSVGLRHLMKLWGVWPASPTHLTRFIGLVPLRWMHAQPTHRTPPLPSAKARGSWKSGVASLNQIKGMGWFGQGQNNQGTLRRRVATSKNFRSGTHRSGMD